MTTTTTNTTQLPEETKAAKRSTKGGIPATVSVATGSADHLQSTRQVPSYVAKRGCSVEQAAKSLGLRTTGRREGQQHVVAEIHEQGCGGFLCVLAG